MKLQALLYCSKEAKSLPKNLLVVLESLSEFKYCSRHSQLLPPAASHCRVVMCMTPASTHTG